MRSSRLQSVAFIRLHRSFVASIDFEASTIFSIRTNHSGNSGNVAPCGGKPFCEQISSRGIEEKQQRLHSDRRSYLETSSMVNHRSISTSSLLEAAAHSDLTHVDRYGLLITVTFFIRCCGT